MDVLLWIIILKNYRRNLNVSIWRKSIVLRICVSLATTSAGTPEWPTNANIATNQTTPKDNAKTVI